MTDLDQALLALFISFVVFVVWAAQKIFEPLNAQEDIDKYIEYESYAVYTIEPFVDHGKKFYSVSYSLFGPTLEIFETREEAENYVKEQG